MHKLTSLGVAGLALCASGCLIACSSNTTPSAEDARTQQVIAQAKEAAAQYAEQQRAYQQKETELAIAENGVKPFDGDRSAVDWQAVSTAVRARAAARREAQHEADLITIRRAAVKAMIPVLKRRYPGVRGMTADDFTALMGSSLVNDYNTPVLFGGEINGKQLILYTSSAEIRALGQVGMLLTQINDQFVAWCGCDGETDIAVDYYGQKVKVVSIYLGRDGKSVARW